MGGVARNHAEPEHSEDQYLEQSPSPAETEGKADEKQEKQGDETLQGGDKTRMRGPGRKSAGRIQGIKAAAIATSPGSTPLRRVRVQAERVSVFNCLVSDLAFRST